MLNLTINIYIYKYINIYGFLPEPAVKLTAMMNCLPDNTTSEVYTTTYNLENSFTIDNKA